MKKFLHEDGRTDKIIELFNGEYQKHGLRYDNALDGNSAAFSSRR